MAAVSLESNCDVTTLQPNILTRVCTATDVLLQHARKHYDKEIMYLQSHPDPNPFSSSASANMRTNLDRRTAAENQMIVVQKYRTGTLICASSNTATEAVSVTNSSLLNLMLHALCLCRMPGGPKSKIWLDEINKLIPMVIQATSTAEMCRDTIMMHLFRAGGFDFMPEVIQRVSQHADDAAKKKLFDTLHSHIVWMMMTDPAHFDDHIGCLPLIEQGVIDIHMPFDLPEVIVQMIFPAKRGSLTTTIKEQLQERLKREFTGPLGLPTTADAKYPRLIEKAPRNIIALQPSTPRVIEQDAMKDAKDNRRKFLLCMLYICRKCDKDFAPAEILCSSKDQEEKSAAPASSVAISNPSAATAACSLKDGNLIANSIDLPFSLAEEEACMLDYCSMGSHRMAVNYTIESILEDVSDLPTLCCNMALVYLDKAANMKGASPADKEIMYQNAAAYAFMSTCMLQFENETHNSYDTGLNGKAWYRLGNAFLQLKEHAAALVCCSRAEEHDANGAKVKSLRDEITRSIPAKQLKEKARKSSGERTLIEKLIKSRILAPFIQRAMNDQMVQSSSSKPEEEQKMSASSVEFSGELPLTTIAELKARGNAHFGARRYDEAESEYKQALRLLSPCAGLLAGISQCFAHHSYSLHVEGPEEMEFSHEFAVGFSMCSMMLEPGNVLARFAHVRALMELEWKPQAQEAFTELNNVIAAQQTGSTKLDQWRQDAAALRDRLKEVHIRTPRKRQSSNAPVGERQMFERNQNVISAANVAERRNENEENEEMAEENGVESPSDSRVVSLHVEYAKACIDPSGPGWPIAVNRRQLLRTLEYSSLCQLQIVTRNPVTIYDNPQDEGEHAEARRTLLHRLATPNPFVVQWWIEAPIGEHKFIFEQMESPLSVYSVSSVHNFSNYISWPLKLRRGSTHVAVGFVDLGQLRTVQLLSEEEPPGMKKLHTEEEKEPTTAAAAASNSSGAAAAKPLTWIGYELVPINVAKCEVLLKMMQRPVASPADESELVDHCLSIWYNSTWSPSTLATFRETVDQLLAERSSILKKEVREVLEYWQKHSANPLPMRSSRAFYLQDSQFHDWVVNFTELADRMALVTYGCTRDVLQPTSEWVSAVTTFQLPQPWQYSTSDSVFNVIPLEELLKYRDCHPNIVVAAREYLRDGVRRIRELLVSGSVVASVEFGNVEIGGQATKDIQKLQPTSISWSNICDYAKPRDFHKLLKQVSVRDSVSTPALVHSMYTMNWMKGFKGTYYVDYEGEEERDQIFEHCRAKWTVYAFSKGLQRYLHVPEVNNRWNTCMWPLGNRFYKRWIPEFFDAQRTGVPKMAERVEVLHPPYWYIGSRCPVGMGLQFSYA